MLGFPVRDETPCRFLAYYIMYSLYLMILLKHYGQGQPTNATNSTGNKVRQLIYGFRARKHLAGNGNSNTTKSWVRMDSVKQTDRQLIQCSPS